MLFFFFSFMISSTLLHSSSIYILYFVLFFIHKNSTCSVLFAKVTHNHSFMLFYLIFSSTFLHFLPPSIFCIFFLFFIHITSTLCIPLTKATHSLSFIVFYSYFPLLPSTLFLHPHYHPQTPHILFHSLLTFMLPLSWCLRVIFCLHLSTHASSIHSPLYFTFSTHTNLT